jgi:hypothetical protein
MFQRACRLAAAVCLVMPLTLRAQGFEYAASTGQYRVSQKTSGSQDAMGQTQEFQTTNNELLTVTVARASRDTLALTIFVDSVTAVGPMGMPVPGLDKLAGRTVTAKLSPAGIAYSVVGPTDDSLPNGTQITSELSRLLPRVKAKLAAGASWQDTVTGTVRQNGMSVDRRVVATYTVAGDTTVQGQKAWKLTRETSTTMSGGGAPQGQMMSMEGTATGKGVLVVSQSGVYLGGQSEDHASIKVTLTAQAMDVAITTTTNTSIEKVK